MESKSIVWLREGRVFKQIDSNIQVLKTLDRRVYTMNYDPNRNEIFLEDFDDMFHFDFKIYGMESNLIKHIMRTFENTSNNLGILFNGIKGTGKTVTAKIIANETKLPIIIINAPYPGLTKFISKLNFPCVLFFDEFEKNFNYNEGEDVQLLSIMDGVLNSQYRKVFILTTNNPYINENFIGRPSRIRYKKSFGNLSSEVVTEYLNDNLIDKSKASEILEFIDSLAISTIDILKCVVEEVNIHNCSVSEFKNFINVESARYSYITQCKSYYCGEPNSIEEFKKDLQKIGTKSKDQDGDEYTIDADELGIYDRRVNSSTAAEYLRIGDAFGGYGTIIETLDKDGVLVTEQDSIRYYFKILNIGNKPSLYRGGLLY